MNRMAEQIYELVSIPEALKIYGFNTNRNRRIPCPLHAGKDPNFSYTDQVFHCWTCDARGNVIGLVMQLFNLNFGQAMVRLNNDFNLGLTNEKPTAKSRALAKERMEKRRQEKAEKEMYRSAYLRIAGAHARLMKSGADTDLLSQIEDWLDENIEMVVVR